MEVKNFENIKIYMVEERKVYICIFIKKKKKKKKKKNIFIKKKNIIGLN
jgi:hypothetical protein